MVVQPWSLTYMRTSAGSGSSQERTVKLQSPTSELLVNQAGEYQLVSVHDRFCAGQVTTDRPFVVENIAKPSLSVTIDDKGSTKSSWLGSHGSLRRTPVCVNTPDSVELQLSGKLPSLV